MKKMKTLSILAVATALFGCASVTGYQPTVNTPVGTKQANLAQDMQECKALARQAAGFTTEVGGDTLVGGMAGASTGAIIGSLLTGGASPATVVAAPLGGVLGFWYGGYEADKTYKRAYNSCLTQRGHYVLY